MASVHGRFQPLHFEHLEYVLAALDEAEFVHVGITQYERSQLLAVNGAGAHRNATTSNPLTYFERAEALSLALADAGVLEKRYRIAPFPLERPERLTEFLPLHVPILTTRVEAWNDQKVKLLRSVGYQVVVLYKRDPKGVSGSEIRRLMALDDDAWTQMVPAATVSYLKSLGLGHRIRSEGGEP